ncbi:MAG: GNAT family N-acetyltransferase [Candidatus Competibacteraceae bacterium]
MSYQLIEQLPSVDDYRRLREVVGWHNLSTKATAASLAGSVLSVCVLLEKETVAMGRVVGDGHFYFYLQDVIVHPAHRNRGIGKQITEHLVRRIKATAEPGAFFGLMAAANVAALYEKFGFQPRTADMPGMSMWLTPSEQNVS